MISAIWSLEPERVADFPASFFLRFADRHRLLQARDQLQWRVIEGGSREYVRKLTARLRNGVRTATPVREVRRTAKGVEISLPEGTPGYCAVTYPSLAQNAEGDLIAVWARYWVTDIAHCGDICFAQVRLLS